MEEGEEELAPSCNLSYAFPSGQPPSKKSDETYIRTPNNERTSVALTDVNALLDSRALK